MSKLNCTKICVSLLFLSGIGIINLYAVDARNAVVPQGKNKEHKKVTITPDYDTTRIIDKNSTTVDRKLNITVNFDKNKENVEKPSIRDIGTAWKTTPNHDYSKGKLEYEGMQKKDEKGEFGPIVDGKVTGGSSSYIRGRKNTATAWAYTVTGKHTILCSYATKEDTGPASWSSSTKVKDTHDNCKKDGRLFTVTTPVAGKNISDLIKDMDNVAPEYPHYEDDKKDSTVKAWGMFYNDYKIRYTNDSSVKCPICKSRYSFTDSILIDIDFNCKIALPYWDIDSRIVNPDAWNEWEKLLASTLTHENAHLLDFKTQFMDAIYPFKIRLQVCRECDEKAYKDLFSRRRNLRNDLYRAHITFVDSAYKNFIRFTKRVETDFPLYPMDPDIHLYP